MLETVAKARKDHKTFKYAAIAISLKWHLSASLKIAFILISLELPFQMIVHARFVEMSTQAHKH